MDTKTTVIYHANCLDGFTAAWAAFSRLGRHLTEYVPNTLSPGETFHVSSRNVFFVDCCPSPAVLLQYAKEATSIVVLDHHKASYEACQGVEFPSNVSLHFDMFRSGAMIAFQHFWPQTEPPFFVQYVQDRDLWLRKLHRADDIHAWMFSLPQHDFEYWDHQVARLQSVEGRERAYAEGSALRRSEAKTLESLLVHVRSVRFLGMDNIPLVNVSVGPISDLLNVLCPSDRFAVGWFQRSDGTFKYSLRAKDNVDVAALCARMGGGGHKNAAGFVSSKAPWELTESPTL